MVQLLWNDQITLNLRKSYFLWINVMRRWQEVEDDWFVKLADFEYCRGNRRNSLPVFKKNSARACFSSMRHLIDRNFRDSLRPVFPKLLKELYFLSSCFVRKRQVRQMSTNNNDGHVLPSCSIVKHSDWCSLKITAASVYYCLINKPVAKNGIGAFSIKKLAVKWNFLCRIISWKSWSSSKRERKQKLGEKYKYFVPRSKIELHSWMLCIVLLFMHL